jgi:hypothetical protein
MIGTGFNSAGKGRDSMVYITNEKEKGDISRKKRSVSIYSTWEKTGDIFS